MAALRRGAALAEQFATATVGMRVEHSRARVGEVTSVGDGEHLVTREDGSQSVDGAWLLGAVRADGVRRDDGT